MTRRDSRSLLYGAARLLGDARAVRRGPTSYAKRRARRVVYARSNSTVTRALRKLGLF